MHNPLITLTAGWSAAVVERAGRLLAYRLGESADGSPVTVAAAFARRGRPPQQAARLLMHLPPLDAVQVLTDTLAAFDIDGEPCPDAAATARAALAHAGRAVTPAEVHPERAFLASLFAALFGLRRPTR